MSQLLIIDYGSGNLRSVYNAFLQVADAECSIKVSDDPKLLDWASHVVLPGVGAFGDCMKGLTSRAGMHEGLSRLVEQHAQMPLLGICVGMQMLFEEGHEHGVHKGLGWLKGKVVPFEKSDLKVPHMGWNNLKIRAKHALLEGINDGEHAYFVHSYYAQALPENILATTSYGAEVPAVVGRDNILGAQFHPEKSQQAGLAILKNFLRM